MLKVNPGLKAAGDTLKGINKQVKKTTECTLADVIAYAGAEAIEASGGPRIQVRKLWRSVGVQSKIYPRCSIQTTKCLGELEGEEELLGLVQTPTLCAAKARPTMQGCFWVARIPDAHWALRRRERGRRRAAALQLDGP